MKKRLEAIGVDALKVLFSAVVIGYYLAGAVIVVLILLWMLRQNAPGNPNF